MTSACRPHCRAAPSSPLGCIVPAEKLELKDIVMEGHIAHSVEGKGGVQRAVEAQIAQHRVVLNPGTYVAEPRAAA